MWYSSQVAQGPVARREPPAVHFLELPFAAASCAVARRESATWLARRGTSGGVVEDCRAVVSELVGNAVRHAQPLADGTLRIRITHEGDAVDIAVSDGGAPTLPHRADVGALAVTGRGLAIVEELSTRWWLESSLQGHTVHALLALG